MTTENNETKPRNKFNRSNRAAFVRSMDYGWVRDAAGLPGRALHIGIGIWYYAGIFGKKLGQPFFVSVSRIAREFGLTPPTARRGFKNLENEGLLNVRRRVGKKCEVTLLAPSSENLKTIRRQDNKPGQPFIDSPQKEKSNLPDKVEGVS